MVSYVFGDEDQTRYAQDKREALQKLPDEILAALALLVRTQKIRENSIQIVRLLCEEAPGRLAPIVDKYSGHDQFKACCKDISTGKCSSPNCL